MEIEEKIREIALKKKNRILLVEGENIRVIAAAKLAVKENICIPVLLGDKKSIELKEKNLEGIEILEYKNNPKLDYYANELYKIRKHKGVTVEKAKELLLDPNYFAALLVKLNEVDGAVGGNVYNTADWMRPVFQIVGKKKDVKVISAICFMPIKNKIYFFSDTDFVIDPKAEELASIAINANDFAKKLDIEPKIAFLSYSTHGSGKHKSLKKIKDALEIVKKERSDIVIDGELQLDAAINSDASNKKSSNSILKGEANVLIFPDITVGNVLIHALFQWTDFKFYGSFPIGLNGVVMNGGRSMDSNGIYKIILSGAMVKNL